MRIRSLTYLSRGNIPSMSANSIQSMKMAQALARLVERFCLLTSGDLRSLLHRKRFDFESWYGISTPFCIARLPVVWSCSYPLSRSGTRRGFDLVGPVWARLQRPDLVYSRSWRGLRLAARLGCRALFETHDPYPDSRGIRQLIHAGSLVGLVTISEVLKESYVRNGIPADRVLVAADGVDLNGYAREAAKDALRKGLQLPVDRPIATYAGHLYEHRGIDEILSCAAECQNVHFLLVGGYDDDVAKRREEVRRLRLENVTLTGFVPNTAVPRYLRASDVLLMPYSRRVETSRWMSPLKLFEYMAAGRPIVASALPSIQNVLKDRHNSILVEPDSKAALAGGIQAILSDPNLAETIAGRALTCVTHHTWEARARAVLDFCDNCIGQARHS